jgi:hypothetical protein
VNATSYGNMACLFTSSGAAARKFRYEAQAGNVGINIGVAAPMAFFPFSGWKDSFFGNMHAQGRDAIDFYTEKKVVVERWPKITGGISCKRLPGHAVKKALLLLPTCLRSKQRLPKLLLPMPVQFS